MGVYAKDPDATLDYSVDWTAFMGVGESLNGASWTVTPIEAGGLTLGSELISGNERGIYVSGGIKGHQYRLSCQITTDQGRVSERSLTVRIMER
jgi:hypothetical protein